MPRSRIRAAIAYDFDGTLTPGNMHEYSFIPAINTSAVPFWNEVKNISREQQADEILAYMHLMLEKAHTAKVPVRRKDFSDFGRRIQFFDGVVEWFSRINSYAKDRGITLEHYIISSGIKEMIEGTVIAKKFKAIFASSFMYDHHGIAHWPALAVNYTTKTQYLFRINKRCLDVADDTTINSYVRPGNRPVPFTRMIFIGDGSTDIPCMKLVHAQRGHSIAVFKTTDGDAKRKAQKLINEDRVNFIAPADYSDGSEIDAIIKLILDKVAADAALEHAVLSAV